MRHAARRFATALSLIGAACGGTPDTLAIERELPLADPSATMLHVDRFDRIWLAGPGVIVRIDSAGREAVRHPLRSPAPPRWLASNADRVFFHAGARLTVLPLEPADPEPASADSVLEVSQAPAAALALDPLDRFVFRTAEAGAVVAHDAVTLEPIWGWAAVGGEGSAITLSPLGDSLYEAVAPAAAESHLLVRDVQTGRIIRRVELPHPVHELRTGPDGSIYAVGWSAESDGSVIRLRWWDGDLTVDWRTSFGELGLTAPVRASLAPSGRLLAVLGLQHEAGLPVLDTEAGQSVGRLPGAALDVGFTRSDRLYVLRTGELQRLAPLRFGED
ncbi:MAG: hypothetical protein WD766_01035 [Gemmatimonadota bacterium]